MRAISGRRAAILILLCLAAAAGNVWRAASWPCSVVRGHRGFFAPASAIDGRTVRWARTYAKIEIASTAWRPVRIRLQLHGSRQHGPLGIRLAVEDRLLTRLDAQPGWQEVTLVLASPSTHHERFDLQIFSTLDQEGFGVGVGDVVLKPILTWGPIAPPAAFGAAAGLLAFFLVLPAREPDRHAPSLVREQVYPAQRLRCEVAAVFGATVCVLTSWALLIPPYQVPDEPQHAMRVASVPTQPWISGGDAFELDPRYLNPIAKWHSPALGKLFFRREQFLTRDDVRSLKDRTWNEVEKLEADQRTERWAGASYPPLYHVAVFGLGHPLTVLLGLTPYQSTYAYRLASVLGASGLWALLFANLRRSSLSAMAPSILLFLLVIPTLTFTSAGVNPDAFALPLCAAAMLACWEVRESGAGSGRAFVCLLAAALTKPSGLVLGVALLSALTCLWLFRAVPSDRAWRVARPVGGALLLAFVLFYAWSRPRFAGGEPVTSTLGEWLAYLVNLVPSLWVSLWGRLGWLDYELPGIWYALLFCLAIVSIICMLGKPVERQTAIALGLTFLAYAGIVMFGEFLSLREAGYNLQGRHFLPAALGLSALLLHGAKEVRWGLLGFLIVMHGALFRETFIRYYAGDWPTLVAALPFG